GGYRFIVMPWFPRNLAVWLSGRSLTERLQALSLACDAVCRLHRSAVDVRQGVVHRDIKPNNFLVRGEGAGLEVVVADFGGVKRAHLRTASWNTDRYTAGFAPPDQTLPRKVAPDQSWDAYAMAATVFWGLTGNAPASVMEASALLTRDGRKLVRLAQTRNPTTGDRAALERLSKHAIGRLIQLSEAEALLEEDVERLGEAVARMLPGLEAAGIAADLVEILTDYLQPDPTARNPDLRALRSACQRLGRRAGVATPAVASPGPGLLPPGGETIDLGGKRERSPVLVAVPAPPRPSPVPAHLIGETVQPRPSPRPQPPVAAPEPVRPRPQPTVPRETSEYTASSGRRWPVLVGGVAAVGALGMAGVWWSSQEPAVTTPASHASPPPSDPVEVAPTAGEVRSFNGTEMAYIPAGSFTMGSPESEADRGSDEAQHEVTLSHGFWMMTTEVTQDQWSEWSANPSYFSACGGSCPVEKVSWLDSVRYANAVSAKQKLESCYVIDGEDVSWPKGLDCEGYRLPTEAEWEFAARADDGTMYAGSDDVDTVAWYSGNADSTTHAVGGKASNGFGLYDMSGNVWEWCWDWHGDYPSNASVEPVGVSNGSNRVYRGGSWLNRPANVRSANRLRGTPSRSDGNLGLRLVRSL
ncbi:MAG: sulfatase activating formylglycine-generating enzyme, partial [Myxococcota bacterium]